MRWCEARQTILPILQDEETKIQEGNQALPPCDSNSSAQPAATLRSSARASDFTSTLDTSLHGGSTGTTAAIAGTASAGVDESDGQFGGDGMTEKGQFLDENRIIYSHSNTKSQDFSPLVTQCLMSLLTPAAQRAQCGTPMP